MKPTTFLTTFLAVSLSLLSTLAAPLPAGPAAVKTTPTVPICPSRNITQRAPLLSIRRRLLLFYLRRYLASPLHVWHGMLQDINDACKRGRTFTVKKKDQHNHYYLVTFAYTPNKSVSTKLFSTGTPDWATFVSDNYFSRPQQPFDIVEAPISVQSRGSYIPARDQITGQMTWQSGFISPAALRTLKIVSIEDVSLDAPPSAGCIAQ
ncbi:hypothetical protein EVG20_g1050 [Dentipellis fragilis]|uniref:Uncharacterized protein n=1 Tax=Dentipellis fragilis TaxID=205917 RepID=A0A4Y9ZD87_9AGAM|nr:hypothetical protein EVG20_g1050 [Dentipellis fragilis]